MDSFQLDSLSFAMGMIEAFCEMVERGVKPLALSPALTHEQDKLLRPLAAEAASRYGLQYEVEENFPVTSLAPASETDGKVVILFYRDPAVLEDYCRMRQQVQALLEQKAYDDKAQKEMGQWFQKLLGYPV